MVVILYYYYIIINFQFYVKIEIYDRKMRFCFRSAIRTAVCIGWTDQSLLKIRRTSRDVDGNRGKNGIVLCVWSTRVRFNNVE